MVQKHEVSESVVRRLPRYYRLLQELERQGQAHTSSRELGKRLGMTASQIRQDLSCFGCFGQQGYGYSVTELRENLERIMGLPQLLPAILVGAGNLGQVVAENVRFEQRGFRLIGIFDIKPELVGNQMAGLEIQPMEQLEAFCAQQKPVAACRSVPFQGSGTGYRRASGLSGHSGTVEFQPLRHRCGARKGRDDASG